MRKRSFIVLCLLLVVACGIGLYVRPSAKRESLTDENHQPILSVQQREPTGPASTQPAIPRVSAVNRAAIVESRIGEIKTEVEKGYNEWRAPIEFYGKVVDEHTTPVAGADIQFVWTDLSPQGNSEKHMTSDVNGLFALHNEAGKQLIVKVSKHGYNAYKPFGSGFFYAGENHNFVPDQSNPVIFSLKKKSVAEPLIHIQGPMGDAKGFKIARNDSPLEISLVTGKPVNLGQGDLRVQCQTDDQGKPPGQKYDWKCQVSVPSGGLVETTDELDFQAPVEGYRSSDVINMPASLAKDWSSQARRTYFLKLANGNYARVNFEMVAGGDHFFQVESFLNPAGSRNLEFDPSNEVR